MILCHFHPTTYLRVIPHTAATNGTCGTTIIFARILHLHAQQKNSREFLTFLTGNAKINSQINKFLCIKFRKNALIINNISALFSTLLVLKFCIRIQNKYLIWQKTFKKSTSFEALYNWVGQYVVFSG